MAKDPAFLFYPGDYLRDTQCLSEPAQVAYDRIMCEHMRNICISQEQLNFFTKRLSDEQKKEVLMVLDKVKGGFQISWIAESIEKRRNYSESRRNNRQGKKNISTSYVPHMENEIVIENVNTNNNKKESEKIDFTKPDIKGDHIILPIHTEATQKLWAAWKESRWENHKVRYKMHGEQAEAAKLQGMDFNGFKKTLDDAIAGGWKNLHITTNNHTNGKITDRQQRKQAGRDYLANYYGSDAPGKQDS